ncbi:hypothetical protein LWI29_017492 [Acer saccharum]|uniref:Uncharacterized protein n=1 Tax=Acer saccharum TaxID=4024 RepID=A0AA39SGG0_ACESA|nr:hypothetical protein LWI29_017492 [Acer saccharum]
MFNSSNLAVTAALVIGPLTVAAPLAESAIAGRRLRRTSRRINYSWSSTLSPSPSLFDLQICLWQTINYSIIFQKFSLLSPFWIQGIARGFKLGLKGDNVINSMVTTAALIGMRARIAFVSMAVNDRTDERNLHDEALED